MIRRSGYITVPQAGGTTGNVLEGTQFAQLSRRQYLTVRARAVAPFTGTQVAELLLEDSTLSRAQPTVSTATSAADSPGLTADDIIFSGLVTPGTLILRFTSGAQDSGATAFLWDVTSS